MAKNITLSDWLAMGIESGFLPESVTVNVPDKVGGGTVSYSMVNHVGPVLGDCLRNGMQQKTADKVADKKAAAVFHNAAILGDHFKSLFSRGIWNEKPGGGPRLDPIDKFVRDRAIMVTKDAMRAKRIPLDDVDTYNTVLNKVLANAAWVEATRAEYVPPKAEIDLGDLF